MDLFELIPDSWRDTLDHLRPLLRSIGERIDPMDINPQREKIFAAFDLPPERVKVVILGQDPYPNHDHAMGLAFSVPSGVSPFPPSLRNILAEYVDDLGFETPDHGDLSPWSREGVMLLNPILTCKPRETLSHQGVGWEIFTEHVLNILHSPKIVGVLWGRQAGRYQNYFAPSMTIASPHPSPLSAYRGFFGSRPFTRANDLLVGAGTTSVNWRL